MSATLYTEYYSNMTTQKKYYIIMAYLWQHTEIYYRYLAYLWQSIWRWKALCVYVYVYVYVCEKDTVIG